MSRWWERVGSGVRCAVAFAVLALAAVTYVGVVSGTGHHGIGPPRSDERGAALLHWGQGVNQDVAACAAPRIRMELGDEAFATGNARSVERGRPASRFAEIVAGCGRPGEVADKVWTALIGFGAIFIVALTLVSARSQPLLRRTVHGGGVRAHRYGRSRAAGFEPGVIRGPLSGWR